MGILARLVDGVNAADVGVLLALVWLVVRLEWTRSENAAAHAAITKNIADVRQDLTKNIADVRQGLEKDIAAVKQDLEKDIAGLKQDLTREIDEIKLDVKRLLTGDVAWMQAVLRDRQAGE